MSKTIKRMAIVLGIIFAIVLIEYFELRKKISLSYFTQNREYLETFIANHYVLSVLSFMLTYIGSILLLLPATIILNLVAGYFFSTPAAFIYCLMSFIIGAALSFLFFRFVFRDYLIKRYGATYQKLNEQFKKNGIMFLISLQLFPITPLPVITMLGALSTISLWSFVWSTAIGVAPGILIYVFAGRKILHINSPKEILSWPVLLSLGLLASLTLIPMIIRYLQDKGNKNNSHEISE